MSVIDYKSQAMAELERMNNVDRDARNAQVWRAAIERYAFASHQANYSVVLQWCANELTLEKIEWLVRNKPAGLELDWDVEAERTKLIDAILAARQWPNPAQERKRLGYKTRVELLDLLATMVSKEQLSHLTAAELKSGLAQHREKESQSLYYFDRQGMRWPRLISVTVPPGWVSATSTSEYLRKANPIQLRFYLGKYGAEQTNFFLNS